jgi:hypothetical protein
MCRICDAAASNSEYLSLLEKMVEEDQQRMESAKDFTEKFPSIGRNVYTTLKWPAKLFKPLFEARVAFAIPNNYFQHLLLDGERTGNHFSHGATRSVFFSGDKLILLSKTVGQEVGKPFLTSFMFAHFPRNEYSVAYDGQDMRVSVDVEKPLKNLLTGKVLLREEGIREARGPALAFRVRGPGGLRGFGFPFCPAPVHAEAVQILRV